MSLKKHRGAKLERYKGPIFPSILKQLRQTYKDTNTNNGSKLEDIGKKVGGYIEMTRPKTSDGYWWFWALHFRRDRGKVVILFPWAQDWDKADGDGGDRSIAVYTKGLVSPKTVKSLIQDLVDAMQELRKQ